MTIDILGDPAELSVEDAAAAVVDPAAYADGSVHRALAVLRRESPVHRIEAEGFAPFYAVTKHADIQEIERRNTLFLARPRYKLFRAVDAPPSDSAIALVGMDPPEHTEYRALLADKFRPGGLRFIADSVESLATSAVDMMSERKSSYDFVTDISMQLPLSVICAMLGIPDADRQPILRMTQRNFGSEDPEFAQQPGEQPQMEFAQYFLSVIQDRQANPRDDIASLLSHAELNGERIGLRELIGYFGILSTAGHDTTSATIAGGLHALIDHPDQLERLRAKPELVPHAVEEMIRWTSPVNSFMRTANADTEIHGQKIAAGESVLLLYSSANRDEDVFDDPYTFDIARTPNRHMAFGTGIHFCMGAHLARLEVRCFFDALIPRLRHLELTGEPQQLRTLFVGGLKHLPIRAEVA
jgi:cytochrome P450